MCRLSDADSERSNRDNFGSNEVSGSTLRFMFLSPFLACSARLNVLVNFSSVIAILLVRPVRVVDVSSTNVLKLAQSIAMKKIEH